MFLVNHLKFLWNGGLQPSTCDPVTLRERRTLSTTIFFVLPVAIGLIVSNYYTGGERDNIYIAIATVVVFFGLYLQAYFNQQLLASQIPIAAYWLVMVMAMTSVGVWANTWAWLLCLPAIASLVAGRTAGVLWAVICAATLWVFAYLQFTGYDFPYSGPVESEQALTLALEATMVLLMLSSATFVFRNAQVTAERKLSDTVKQLEKEVHDRTLAENEARQSEQAKASFLAAMSHELRTPLNGVIGASQLLIEGDLPSKKKELIDVVLQSSETLLELINNVMDLSRLDSQSIELEKVPVNIGELFRSTLAPLAFQAKEKGVKFSLVIEDDIPDFVRGDPTRLRQILLNLVGNAVKFTNTGEIEVVLDTALERMRLKVSDTGIGINTQAQASLFEPYVQADKTTMRKFGGSGLGLTIVKQLVSAMGGKIAVNSVPGRGSTFTVFLPLTAAKPPAIKPTNTAEIKLHSLSIVVADDNAVNRMVLSRLLEADGHKVVTMSNGREVLDYLPDHVVDVIMMDLQMPVMDGVTAVRKIRAMDGSRSTIPVIAVTANVVHEDPRDLIRSGMTGFLSKPFRQEELREALQKAMSPNPTGLA
jgi:signal transduction histidine kinase/ActR/RegA family two-component response regulator